MQNTAKQTDRKLEHVFSLWERTSKKGTEYLSGFLGEERIVGFYNKDKRDLKDPDIEIIKSEDDKKNPSWKAHLFLKASKTGRRYATGLMYTDKGVIGIVGFIKEDRTEKQPMMTVFLEKEDE